MTPPPPHYLAAALALILALGGCSRDGGATTDPATVDDGAYRNPAPGGAPPPAMTETTLPSGATIMATPSTAALQAYLQSPEPAGRRFPLPAVRFVGGMEVREDPNGALAGLAAVINGSPGAKVRIEVMRARPQQDSGEGDPQKRAELVAQALIRNGVAPSRVTFSGVDGGTVDAPQVFLVVTEK